WIAANFLRRCNSASLGTAGNSAPGPLPPRKPQAHRIVPVGLWFLVALVLVFIFLVVALSGMLGIRRTRMRRRRFLVRHGLARGRRRLRQIHLHHPRRVRRFGWHAARPRFGLQLRALLRCLHHLLGRRDMLLPFLRRDLLELDGVIVLHLLQRGYHRHVLHVVV